MVPRLLLRPTFPGGRSDLTGSGSRLLLLNSGTLPVEWECLTNLVKRNSVSNVSAESIRQNSVVLTRPGRVKLTVDSRTLVDMRTSRSVTCLRCRVVRTVMVV